VIIAALDPTDPRRDKAREILEVRNNKVISELVVAELGNVLHRHYETLVSVRDRLGVDKYVATKAVILYIMKRFNLRYINVRGFTRTVFGRIYIPFALTIELAGKIRLKTLDLLHIAYVKAMKEQGLSIHTLLTADTDFKNVEKDLKELLGVQVELVD